MDHLLRPCPSSSPVSPLPATSDEEMANSRVEAQVPCVSLSSYGALPSSRSSWPTCGPCCLRAPSFWSFKRVDDLCASCLDFGPNDCRVILKPRHGYVPKVLSTPFRAQVYYPSSTLRCRAACSITQSSSWFVSEATLKGCLS